MAFRVKLQMPAERCNAPRQCFQLFKRRTIAAHGIEAHATRAARMQPLQRGIIKTIINHHHNARAFQAELFCRIQGYFVLGPVNTRLHNHHAFNAKRRSHAPVIGNGRILRVIMPPGIQRKAVIRPEDMEMAVTGKRGCAPGRARRGGEWR